MTDRQLTAVLAGSAAAAVRAPSIHNTRPWRWVLHTRSLDLYVDRRRQLTDIDPDGRLILISCGGALHHARTALAADGLGAQVSLLPDADPDHVATLTPTGPVRTDHTVARARQLLSEPSIATEPSSSGVELAETAATLVAEAEGEGVHMRLLDRAQVMALAGASSVTRKVRERIGLDASTVYAVLYGEDDTAPAWLRAGEALSAVSLEAARLGLSVYPSWTVVELPGARKLFRRHIFGSGVPYLALRIAAAGDRAPSERGLPEAGR